MAAEIVQTLELPGASEKLTGRPELAAAPTEYEPPTTAAGGDVVKAIDCAVFDAGTVGGFDGAPPPPPGDGVGWLGWVVGSSGDDGSGASRPGESVVEPAPARSCGPTATSVVSTVSMETLSSTSTASEAVRRQNAASPADCWITERPSARIAARASGVDA